MKAGMEILRERAAARGIEIGDEISMSMFDELGLPMVVACTGCEMTMAMPNSLVADDGHTYCSDCGGE
jgi:hypothetical protein